MNEPEKVGPGRWTYRGYTITDDGYVRRYAYVSDDYDGAPLETGGPPADHRCGEVWALSEAVHAIDELITEEEKNEA